MEVEDVKNEIVRDGNDDKSNVLCPSYPETPALNIGSRDNIPANSIKTELEKNLEFSIFLKTENHYLDDSETLIDHNYGKDKKVQQYHERNEIPKNGQINPKAHNPANGNAIEYKEDSNMLNCGICDKDFKQACHLKNHIRIHFLEKKFICNVCHKTFAFLGHLKNHVSVHTGEKNFTCTVCPKSFRQKGHLINHVRIHLGLKKFSCPVCDRKFTQNIHMKNHLKTHTGEKNYKCKICCKGFIQSGQLDNHMTIHTGERKYECEQCGMRFKQVGHLIGHFKTHNKSKR